MVYSIGAYLFSVKREAGGVMCCGMIHSSGRYVDYNHPFSSVDEMQEYVRSL